MRLSDMQATSTTMLWRKGLTAGSLDLEPRKLCLEAWGMTSTLLDTRLPWTLGWNLCGLPWDHKLRRALRPQWYASFVVDKTCSIWWLIRWSTMLGTHPSIYLSNEVRHHWCARSDPHIQLRTSNAPLTAKLPTAPWKSHTPWTFTFKQASLSIVGCSWFVI